MGGRLREVQLYFKLLILSAFSFHRSLAGVKRRFRSICFLVTSRQTDNNQTVEVRKVWVMGEMLSFHHIHEYKGETSLQDDDGRSVFAVY